MEIDEEDDLKVYTPRQLARLLHVADERIYRLIHTKKILVTREGRNFFIRRSEALRARDLLNR